MRNAAGIDLGGRTGAASALLARCGEAPGKLMSIGADGRRMVHDYTMSLRKARAGAGANDRGAAFRLAQMLGLGLGCVQDYEQAVHWYRLAAELGHAQAQCNLGFMYGTGRGVPQDYVRAYAWYNVSAASGEDTARRNRDAVARRMSPSQIERAQDMSAELFELVASLG